MILSSQIKVVSRCFTISSLFYQGIGSFVSYASIELAIDALGYQLQSWYLSALIAPLCDITTHSALWPLTHSRKICGTARFFRLSANLRASVLETVCLFVFREGQLFVNQYMTRHELSPGFTRGKQ